MLNVTLDQVLDSPDLPTIPQVAVQVLQLTRDLETDLSEIARVIERDQALATRVLRTVNSSFFALRQPCTSIRQALVLLGTNAVRVLVLGFTLVEHIDGGGSEDVTFDFVTYWRRALYSAATARLIARASGACDPEEAFLGALLQDLGMVALHRALGDRYLQVIDMARGDHRALPGIEAGLFEFTHAEVGAALAAQWRLPEPFVQSIRHHHDPSCADETHRPLVQTVELALQVALVLMSPAEHARMTELEASLETFPGCAPDSGSHILEQAAGAAAELSELLRIDLGAPPNVEAIMAEASARREAIRTEIEMRAQGDDSGTRHDAA